MVTRNVQNYQASDFGQKEVDLQRSFDLEVQDARNYFLTVTKPRLDRAYKLYVAYNGDRQREIQSWQANIFVPYVQATVETLMPRVLDARPEFSVIGRTEEDTVKGEKQQQLADFFWEQAQMDRTSEDFTRATMIYGTGFLQVSWKKDVRTLKFLKSKDISKKPEWKEEERVFYDGPMCEWVDNYALWYDWHNTDIKSKQFFFKRLVLTEDEIKRRYPGADKKRLDMALASPGGDLTDYAAIRQQVRSTHDKIVKGAQATFGGSTGDKYTHSNQNGIEMYEVFEWFRPFKDSYAVIIGANHVPIFKNGEMPIPFDFKEAPFVAAQYLKIPGEFEGYGLPLILENPQIMLNMVKNQRLDAATLSIHKMWVVNPLANIDKNQLVTRPFGIIYSIDPNGVKEIQFSDLKASAYKEEEMLKGDMRYSSGVDDFSMGVGGGASSATEVRHLRESTLERVRLFVNHLGDAYSDVLRYWMSMSRQLMTKEMTLRIIGADGAELYPIIEKDDLMGIFDYRAKVLPSIAGQQDVNKKQAMDLFQLLSQIDPAASGIDLRKLIGKTITNWGMSIDSISSEQEAPEMDPAMAGMEGMEGMDPAALAEMGMDPAALQAMMAGGGAPEQSEGPGQLFRGKMIPSEISQSALSLLRKPGEAAAGGQSPFSQMSSPQNLLQAGMPPTAKGVPSASGGPGPRGNMRGLNRKGKVDTNISTGAHNSSVESNLLNRSFNIQR